MDKKSYAAALILAAEKNESVTMHTHLPDPLDKQGLTQVQIWVTLSFSNWKKLDKIFSEGATEGGDKDGKEDSSPMA